ncbi:hypothetical protein JZ751_009188 [Albula glossodonta]|uniref:Uncharacterized protein n=1 Tax=Albula glossodonta TaxID=121402 RepID=A0A8T2N2H9_9TELE|nr:hypothetical protein JZ751_009188 [Albula glossodonta]
MQVLSGSRCCEQEIRANLGSRRRALISTRPPVGFRPSITCQHKQSFLGLSERELKKRTYQLTGFARGDLTMRGWKIHRLHYDHHHLCAAEACPVGPSPMLRQPWVGWGVGQDLLGGLRNVSQFGELAVNLLRLLGEMNVAVVHQDEVLIFVPRLYLGDVNRFPALGSLYHGVKALGGSEKVPSLFHVVLLLGLQRCLHVLLSAALQEVELLLSCGKPGREGEGVRLWACTVGGTASVGFLGICGAGGLFCGFVTQLLLFFVFLPCLLTFVRRQLGGGLQHSGKALFRSHLSVARDWRKPC